MHTRVDYSRRGGTYKMATNREPGKGRKGAVAGRTQFKSARTALWHKRHTRTGKILDVKTSAKRPFKGIRKEK